MIGLIPKHSLNAFSGPDPGRRLALLEANTANCQYGLTLSSVRHSDWTSHKRFCDKLSTKNQCSTFLQERGIGTSCKTAVLSVCGRSRPASRWSNNDHVTASGRFDYYYDLHESISRHAKDSNKTWAIKSLSVKFICLQHMPGLVPQRRMVRHWHKPYLN